MTYGQEVALHEQILCKYKYLHKTDNVARECR